MNEKKNINDFWNPLDAEFSVEWQKPVKPFNSIIPSDELHFLLSLFPHAIQWNEMHLNKNTLNAINLI